MGNIKFVKVMEYKSSQYDKNIMKYLFEKTMNGLYETFNIEKDESRHLRDQAVKDIIQGRNKTYLVMAYSEVISDTDNKNIKKVSITLARTSDRKPSEAELFLLKVKIQKIYEDNNKKIANLNNNEPFLSWDGNILFDNTRLTQNIHSANAVWNTIAQQTWIDMSALWIHPDWE
jgi:hypothetical protein